MDAWTWLIGTYRRLRMRASCLPAERAFSRASLAGPCRPDRTRRGCSRARQLTVKSRTDGSDSSDGHLALDLHPVPGIRARRERIVRPCTDGVTRAGDDPALGDTGCTFPDRAALKTAVDNCLAVDATGVACAARAWTAAPRDFEMPYWDVIGDGREQLVPMERILQRGHIAVGRQLGHEHGEYVEYANAFNADISRWTSARSRPWQVCFIPPISSTLTYLVDVSSVIEMRHMFQNAYAFNKDISRWTTSGSACCSFRGPPTLARGTGCSLPRLPSPRGILICQWVTIRAVTVI